jgi:hypothetical protein
VALLPTAALADQLLKKAAGDWRGSGEVVIPAGAKPETVRCRLSNRYDPRSGRLTVSGRCAAAGEIRRLDGWIERTNVIGNFRGSWGNPSGAGRVSLFGGSSGEAIHLNYKFKNAETGEIVSGLIVWRIGENRLVIQNAIFEQGAFRSTGDVTFMR